MNALLSQLDDFHGTETWHRHYLNRRLLHTDGVQFFAEKAGAFWFIDAMAVGVNGKKGPVPSAVPNKSYFGVVLLTSKNESATIEVRSDYDENDKTCGKSLYRAKISFTDCPEGVWKFYLVDDGEHTVLMVPSEY
jgi:hypothetical protein